MFKPKHFHMDNYWCRFRPLCLDLQTNAYFMPGNVTFLKLNANLCKDVSN